MPGHVNKRNNAMLRVADVVDLKAEVIEVFGERRGEPSHAVMSAVGVALQPSISRVPDEVGREEGEGSIDSFRAKGLEHVPHKLDVLLRHRPPSISAAYGEGKGPERDRTRRRAAFAHKQSAPRGCSTSTQPWCQPPSGGTAATRRGV